MALGIVEALRICTALSIAKGGPVCVVDYQSSGLLGLSGEIGSVQLLD